MMSVAIWKDDVKYTSTDDLKARKTALETLFAWKLFSRLYDKAGLEGVYLIVNSELKSRAGEK